MVFFNTLANGLELLAFGTLDELSHVGMDGCGDILKFFDFCGNDSNIVELLIQIRGSGDGTVALALNDSDERHEEHSHLTTYLTLIAGSLRRG